jgi:hypothetical protein
LRLELRHLQINNELLTNENKGLCGAFVVKKHKKHGRVLDLQQHEEYHGGAVLWSSCKVRKANVQEAVKEQKIHEEKLAKANRKELREAAQLHNELQKDQRHVEAEVKKKQRKKEKDEL